MKGDGQFLVHSHHGRSVSLCLLFSHRELKLQLKPQPKPRSLAPRALGEPQSTLKGYGGSQAVKLSSGSHVSSRGRDAPCTKYLEDVTNHDTRGYPGG